MEEILREPVELTDAELEAVAGGGSQTNSNNDSGNVNESRVNSMGANGPVVNLTGSFSAIG
jgi:hypothetical protein